MALSGQISYMKTSKTDDLWYAIDYTFCAKHVVVIAQIGYEFLILNVTVRSKTC